MREFLLPGLRADVEMYGSYRSWSNDAIPVPITSIRGCSDDLVSPHAAGEWKKLTSKSFDVVEFEGAHMYLTEHLAHLAGTIEKTIFAGKGGLQSMRDELRFAAPMGKPAYQWNEAGRNRS